MLYFLLIIVLTLEAMRLVSPGIFATGLEEEEGKTLVPLYNLHGDGR